MKAGMGARLEASFRPSVHWGAEFLADRVRICGLAADKGPADAATPRTVESFEGTWEEAEKFARSRGLALEGLHGAVSHLPFKLESLPAGGEEEIGPHAERLKPVGIPLDAIEYHVVGESPEASLLLARESAVQALVASLPDSLSALWTLAPSPLALLPFAVTPAGRQAALMVEESHTHVLFLRDGALEGYAKAFIGEAEARQDPDAFAREFRKVLIYHRGTRFPGTSLDGLSLWSSALESAAPKALEALGLAVAIPTWKKPLASVPGPFRVSAAMAATALAGDLPLASFSIPVPIIPADRRKWKARAGLLARTAYPILALLTLAALLLAGGALVLRAVVDRKASQWAGELQAWDRFQDRRVVVEKRLDRIQGLLARRTTAYASFQGIAVSLPPEVWIEGWDAESGEGGKLIHRLTGYSQTEDKIPLLLAGLEKDKAFRNVKLKTTEKVDGEKVEKETGLKANRRDLVRFQVVVSE